MSKSLAEAIECILIQLIDKENLLNDVESVKFGWSNYATDQIDTVLGVYYLNLLYNKFLEDVRSPLGPFGLKRVFKFKNA